MQRSLPADSVPDDDSDGGLDAQDSDRRLQDIHENLVGLATSNVISRAIAPKELARGLKLALGYDVDAEELSSCTRFLELARTGTCSTFEDFMKLMPQGAEPERLAVPPAPAARIRAAPQKQPAAALIAQASSGRRSAASSISGSTRGSDHGRAYPSADERRLVSFKRDSVGQATDMVLHVPQQLDALREELRVATSDASAAERALEDSQEYVRKLQDEVTRLKLQKNSLEESLTREQAKALNLNDKFEASLRSIDTLEGKLGEFPELTDFKLKAEARLQTLKREHAEQINDAVGAAKRDAHRKSSDIAASQHSAVAMAHRSQVLKVWRSCERAVLERQRLLYMAFSALRCLVLAVSKESSSLQDPPSSQCRSLSLQAFLALRLHAKLSQSHLLHRSKEDCLSEQLAAAHCYHRLSMRRRRPTGRRWAAARELEGETTIGAAALAA